MTTGSLRKDITKVKGVGVSYANRLAKLGICTIGDLLHHFPSRYFDFTEPVSIDRLKTGQTSCFIARLEKPRTFFSKTGKIITQVKAKDASGKIILTWFNNPYIKKIIHENSVYTIAGKPTYWGSGLTVVAPLIEEGTDPSINTRGLVPLYPQTAGVTSKWLRSKIDSVLSNIDLSEPIDKALIDKLDLISTQQAFKNIHFPQTESQRKQADKRLSFNEHLKINLNNQLEIENLGKSPKIKIDQKITQKSQLVLPFTLTLEQQKTIVSIYLDLGKSDFTHRLIQGETGSGKTATLLFAANQSIKNQYSCAIMAPTEILATQHFQTFSKLSLFPNDIQLITSSTKTSPNLKKPTVYIGTHSLLNSLPSIMEFPLAFIAIDEQHKFGVEQRNELLKRTPVPHIFNLSATPIPRTVALGLLGDISISNITNRPQNRQPVKTFVVTPTHFKSSPAWITQKLTEGNQIFIVCPNINEHDTGIASVEKTAEIYKKITANRYAVLSLHGKMTPEEQKKTIDAFRRQKGSILVSTSIIEVGIDIPTANIMIIHSAERFGLASLHQLRGRVGRGEAQGLCFLVPTTDEEEEIERLQLLQKYHSGLVLAKKDLMLRGAGEVFGTKQHGSLPTRLSYFWSKKLYLKAKITAKMLIKTNKDQAKQIASELQTC